MTETPTKHGIKRCECGFVNLRGGSSEMTFFWQDIGSYQEALDIEQATNATLPLGWQCFATSFKVWMCSGRYMGQLNKREYREYEAEYGLVNPTCEGAWVPPTS